MRQSLCLLCLVGPIASAAVARAESYINFYASTVVDYSPGPGNFFNSTASWALDGPRGEGEIEPQTQDVVTLGVQGSLTLGFAAAGQDRVITDGPGADFIVFENPFRLEGTTNVFAELMRVQVSTDGESFAEFPTHCEVPGPVGQIGTIDPTKVHGFAGVHPVLANVDDPNTPSAYDASAAGGDAFDLSALADVQAVRDGSVDLDNIRYVRLVDVLGDGSEADSNGHAIYDPTGVYWMGPPFMELGTSADVDAVSVIHGLPEPRVRIVGDADEDGDVDHLDYMALKVNFGTGPGATWSAGDFDKDGYVTRADLLLFQQALANGAVPASVPEPAALAMLAAGALPLLRARRKRR